MLKWSIAMRMQAVKQFAPLRWAMIIVLGSLGCGNVIPSVYWMPWRTASHRDISITTFYPDGTVKDCLGKGTIRGRIHGVEVYPEARIMRLTIKDSHNQEYTITLPGWKQAVAPVESDWWVEVNYGFDEKVEWMRILAQGHGQVLMYYNGRTSDSKGVDPILQCKPGTIEFRTARRESMTCMDVMAHYSTLCTGTNHWWKLSPGDTRLINARSALRPKAGTMVLQMVDAFRTEKGCGHTRDRGLTYYWFKTPRIVAREELTGKQ